MKNVIDELFQIIEIRKAEMPEGSYTTSLFKEGENKIIKKLGEELAELVMAVSKDDKEQTVYETADLIYHLLVMLSFKGIKLNEIYEELQKRQSNG